MLNNKHIIVNQNIRFGKPVINGTRISVNDVIDWLKSGMTIDEILDDFPELNCDQIKACIEFNKQELIGQKP